MRQWCATVHSTRVVSIVCRGVRVVWSVAARVRKWATAAVRQSGDHAATGVRAESADPSDCEQSSARGSSQCVFALLSLSPLAVRCDSAPTANLCVQCALCAPRV